MPTQIQYALMAAASYISTRPFDINKFPVPKDWIENEAERRALPSGFEATTFKNGTELVISFAGTYPSSLPGTTNGTSLGLPVDFVADIDLGVGYGSPQLLQAAQYYLDRKRENPRATITLTGHSLGGGLAALVGVFFGLPAVTFDQAPFANSAQDSSVLGSANYYNILVPDVAATLKANLIAKGYTADELFPLSNYLAVRATGVDIPNSNLVTHTRVDGEFLSAWVPISMYDPIGNPATVIDHAPTSANGIDLHAQSLLIAFLQSAETASAMTSAGKKQSLSEVTYKLTDLLGMLVDKKLYLNSTDTKDENFLERLVRHEFGNAPDGNGGTIAADAMLTRFTADLWKLAQDGGLTLNDGSGLVTTYSNWNNVSKALTAFVMQFYYENTANAKGVNKQLFEVISGGVQFDFFNVSEKFQTQFESDGKINLDDAKGYKEYFTKYLSDNPHPFLTREDIGQIKYLLPYLRDWYVQAGAEGMVASDTQNRGAFMLGGNGADMLTGGTADDLLVGNAGADTLDGGTGDGNDILLGGTGEDTLKGGDGMDMLLGGADNDTLEGGKDNDILKGGAGNDTYVFTDEYGTDVITDSDGSGLIQVGGQNLGNATQIFDSVYKDDASGQIFVKLNGGKSLVIQKENTGNRILVNDWPASGDLGIALQDKAAEVPVATLTGGFKKLIDLGDPASLDDDVYKIVKGNYVSDGDDANAPDMINGSGGDDVIDGGAGDDALTGHDGDDYIIGGLGGDMIQGGKGKDTLIGGAGDDLIYGSSDADILMPSSLKNYTPPVNDFSHPRGTGFNWYSGYYDTIADGVPLSYSNSPRDRLDDDKENVIDGGIGNDFIAAGTGADIVHGGENNDFIFGMDKGDILFGDAGNDLIYGDGNQPGNNSVVWTLYKNHGNDVIDGGERQ